VKKALKDEHWICAIQDELLQFSKNDVWELVPRLSKTNVIGTKWLYKNNVDKNGTIVCNKASFIS